MYIWYKIKNWFIDAEPLFFPPKKEIRCLVTNDSYWVMKLVSETWQSSFVDKVNTSIHVKKFMGYTVPKIAHRLWMMNNVYKIVVVI